MKTLITAIALAVSASVAAEEIQYADVVSVTPLTTQVATVKSTCVPIGSQSSSFWGSVLGAPQDPPKQNCREILTYEPQAGGYQVVYQLDGQQYTMRTREFPRSMKIPVRVN